MRGRVSREEGAKNEVYRSGGEERSEKCEEFLLHTYTKEKGGRTRHELSTERFFITVCSEG